MKFDEICRLILNEEPQGVNKHRYNDFLSEMAKEAATLNVAPDADASVLQKPGQEPDDLNNAQKIFNFIAENPNTTISVMAAHFGKRFQVIRHYVRNLEAKGLVGQTAPTPKEKPIALAKKRAPGAQTPSRKAAKIKMKAGDLALYNDMVDSAFDAEDKSVLSYEEIKSFVETIEGEFFEEHTFKKVLDWMVNKGKLVKVGEDMYKHVDLAADDEDVDPDVADKAIGDAKWLSGDLGAGDTSQYVDTSDLARDREW